MKKNFGKKILTLFLVFVMLFSVNTSVFAGSERTTITIFDDAFNTTVFTKTDGTSGTTEYNYNVTDSPASGTCAFSLKNKATYGGVRLTLTFNEALNVEGMNAKLCFSAKGANGGENARFNLVNSDGKKIYTINSLTTSWKNFSIADSTFKKTGGTTAPANVSDVLKDVKQIEFYLDGGKTIYYDDIYIEMDAEPTIIDYSYVPDYNCFDENTDNKLSGFEISEAYASSGTISLKSTYTGGTWDTAHYVDLKNSVPITKDIAEHGYLTFKAKGVFEGSTANVCLKLQRTYEGANWNYSPGSFVFQPSADWAYYMIPLKDMVKGNVTSNQVTEYRDESNLTDHIFRKIYFIGNGFNGDLYVDEIGFYFPKLTAALTINGEYAENVSAGSAEVTAKLRGVYDTPVNVYIAVYEDGELKSVDVNPFTTVSEREEADYSFTAKSNTSVRAFAWYKDSNEPLINFFECGESELIVKYLLPDYKEKAVTFSCDDGAKAADTKMVELLKENNLKATFNLVGNFLKGENGTWYVSAEDAPELYNGFEVASHSSTHPYWDEITDDEAKKDISDNQTYLNTVFGYTPEGFAWAYGDPQNSVLYDYLEEIGIEYARPVNTALNYEIPTDWLVWKQYKATVTSVNNVGNDFLNNCKYDGKPKVLAFWLHSWEWNTDGKFIEDGTADEQWAVMDAFMKKVAADEKIWSCTNLEFAKYAKALDLVEIEGRKITNNSQLDVYLNVNGENVIIKAGESLTA